MHVTKACFALISAWEQLIMFQSVNMIIIGSQCYTFISETSLNFKMAKLLNLGMNYS